MKSLGKSLTFALLLSEVLSVTSAVGQTPPPSVSSVRPVPGELLKIENVSCGPGKSPAVVLDSNLELAPVGSGTKWSVMLPVSLPAQKSYSMRWRCGPADPKEAPLQIAALEVRPLIPEVTSASVSGGKRSPGVPQLELKNRLDVEVKDLKPWRELSAANAAAVLHLYLADVELKNLTMAPAGERMDEATGRWFSTVTVMLDINDDKDSVKRNAWIEVLRSAMNTPPTKTSVGPAGGQPFSSSAAINLRVLPPYTWLVVVFLGVLALALIVLGKRSTLLRDANGAADPPYSLARHQMAVWLLVVVGGYLYAWLITGSAAVSLTALILIGISGATGLLATTIDGAKRQEQMKTRVSLAAERDSLNNLIVGSGGLQAQLNAAGPGSPQALQIAASLQANAARLSELNTLLGQPVPEPAHSRAWYLDLLSDENGISFHRLQIAIWTIVLVGVFVRAVYTDVVMPEFDTTTLGLMGIASGTYLGFKLPEKK